MGILAGLSLALPAATVDARTWYIRADGAGDAPTIQAGIDSSAAGDIVLVAPGIYTWTTQGHAGEALIRLKADIVLRGDAGASTTVLDAERQGRVLDCVDVGNARVEGLTITGGSAWDSGGIYSSGNTHLTISDCIVRGNLAGQTGGGVSCSGATITHCEILDNFAGGGPSGYAGGLECYDCTIVGCRIQGNRVDGQGAGGGGAHLWDSSMRDCWIEGNWATGATVGSWAGGVSAFGTGERDSIVSCTFVRNSAGAGSALTASRMSVVDCVFVGNESHAGPATVSLEDSDMIGCTVVYNVGAGYPDVIGGVYVYRGATVRSTIVAWNEGNACYGWGTWVCCDVFANTLGDALCGADGGGNLNADPQFCATDPSASLNFALQADSPCAPGNHPAGSSCGLIGAGSVACATVPVSMTTWSRVKSLYRDATR